MKYSPDKELNALGFICPYPIIETSKMIKNIEVGEIIAIKADDLAIILDMPAWCHSNGHEYLGEEKLIETKGYIVYVRKGNRKN
ncbi:MAG: sulfurtransferase TusA family protein [Candidatus Marinimicrobia bacterium]|nr:sulfurtransferase TusA family protein [Candidatus Neomarinimicrobiota bacterium]MCH7954631.1 sulfurtransferase TusA family protein [Candidatus Neomarinimicrobiota bacterium]